MFFLFSCFLACSSVILTAFSSANWKTDVFMPVEKMLSVVMVFGITLTVLGSLEMWLYFFGHISAFISVHSGAIRAESHRGVGQLGFAHFQGRESELPAGFIRNSCHLQHLYKHMLKSCFNTGEMLLETFYSSVFTCERANRPCDVNLLLLNI